MELEIVSCCGMVCTACGYYPGDCPGCPEIRGRAFWLEYTGGEVCDIYRCCVEERRLPHCGGCEELPCARYGGQDPTLSLRENQAIQNARMARLRAMKKEL